MTKNVIQYANPDTSPRTPAKNMKQFHRGCPVVTRGGKLSGIVIETDLVQRVLELLSEPIMLTVSEVLAQQ